MFPSGFVPYSRASFMMDFVAVAMAGILPVLAWSVYLVKRHKNYRLHKLVQLSLGTVLLVAVSLFEVDVRLYGWRQNATLSPYYNTILFPFLYFHLLVACTTTVLWIATITLAVRRFPKPPVPGAHSPLHRRLGWAGTIGMFATSITGWTFYWMAFVAT